MKKVLSHSFFNRPTLTVAEGLIGKFLVRRINGKARTYMILETEAYDGFKDKASHIHPARGGAGPRKTARNEIMFRTAGHIYVYLTYGMHYMLNIVTGGKEYPAAILIRGVEGVNGPGRLTRKLRIDTKLNGKLLGKTSGLWIEDRGVAIPKKLIQKTPRVGVRYAKEWAQKPYRFILKDKDIGNFPTLDS